MKLRTNIKPFISNNKIEYKDNLFFIGSCFSQNISNELSQRKFKTYTNPFGISYNPISVFDSLESVLTKRTYSEKDFFYFQEKWSSFDFHSDMSSLSKIIAVENVNTVIEQTNNFLNKTNYLFITFGTAWVYEKNDKVVANCHKIPNREFNKKLLSVGEIVDKALVVLKKMFANNESLKVILTISPVRHLKDGFIENNQSKSTLHLAVKEICSRFVKQVEYFPSYEMVLDDLRDYRFYKEDLIHPNNLAIQYIFNQFNNTYFNTETKETIKNIEKINNSLNHKVKFKETERYQKFKKSILNDIEKMESEGFDFKKEKLTL